MFLRSFAKVLHWPNIFSLISYFFPSPCPFRGSVLSYFRCVLCVFRISTITNKIILIYTEIIEMSVQKQPSFLCEVSYLRVYVWPLSQRPCGEDSSRVMLFPSDVTKRSVRPSFEAKPTHTLSRVQLCPHILRPIWYLQRHARPAL